MTFDEFTADLNRHYYDLWNIGLKKKANLSLKKYLQEFNDTIDENTRFNIWYKFCDNYCSNKNTANWRYGKPSSLPYEISKNVIDYLNIFSNTMPQIKWLYVLTNDRDILNQAFNHIDCDQEVIEYKFLNYIETLDWGSHHASEGIMIIGEELIQATITDCLSMIEKYKIPTQFQNSLNYYIRLYELLKLFSESNCNDFTEFCELYNFPFNGISTFYYTK